MARGTTFFVWLGVVDLLADELSSLVMFLPGGVVQIWALLGFSFSCRGYTLCSTYLCRKGGCKQIY